MSSVAGRYGFANRSPYAATKWGVIGFTKTLAIELGEWGIRANAIAPGAVEGDRIERVFAGRAQISGRSMNEVRDAAMAEQSIKTMIDPQNIAALAVFLASDAAKSISGQVLPIDNDGSGRDGFEWLGLVARMERSEIQVLHGFLSRSRISLRSTRASRAYYVDLTRLDSNIDLISAIKLGVSLSANPCASMHLSIFRL